MTLTFEAWMKQVNLRIENTIGLSSDDLPDINYRDLYDNEVNPSTAAWEAIKGAME